MDNCNFLLEEGRILGVNVEQHRRPRQLDLSGWRLIFMHCNISMGMEYCITCTLFLDGLVDGFSL